MKKITKKDLLSLEQYHEQRNTIRTKLREHKALRRLAIGPHVHLFFEDKKTMQYQIQEMLYVEKILDQAEIQQELDTYNPMLPDGDNWKATMMIEYVDEDERKQALRDLVNIENQVYVKISSFDKIYAIADEDLERSDATKTSAVHFLRFQLTEEVLEALRKGSDFSFGIDHPNYSHEASKLSEVFRAALLEDLAN